MDICLPTHLIVKPESKSKRAQSNQKRKKRNPNQFLDLVDIILQYAIHLHLHFITNQACLHFEFAERFLNHYKQIKGWGANFKRSPQQCSCVASGREAAASRTEPWGGQGSGAPWPGRGRGYNRGQDREPHQYTLNTRHGSYQANRP